MLTQSANEYQSLTEIQHVLQRHDMYISSIHPAPRMAKCLVLSENKIVVKQVTRAEGDEQTFVEIVGNAADNVIESREKGIDPGCIEVNMDAEWVSVKNYGLAIPVALNANGRWIPNEIFGNLRSSSKYDDSKKRYLIGKNGLGAKATNIFCKKGFIVECADPERGLLYRQMWQNNMTVVSEPERTAYSGPGYTKITYSLDFERFGVSGFDNEAFEIYAAHCAAISLTCEIPVYFNGTKFEIKDLIQYASLFYKVDRSSAICYKDPNGAYELCVIDTPDTGEVGRANAVCVSFVNGIVTSNGGVHVDEAYKVVVKAIIEYMGKMADGIQLTKRDIVNHVSLFISCRIDKPNFTSQIKDVLKSPTPKIVLPDKLLQGIKKWKLIQIIYMEIQRKRMNKLKKTDGKRKKKPRTEGAEPANWAGGVNSHLTTFILTEGESPDSYRLKFISQIPDGQGRNYFGSLPLHGKLLNVLNADFMQIMEHRDLNAIKDNLGLKEETDYRLDENIRKLNYGSLLIMPDPDNDGKHILGLVLLFFMCRFPGLVEKGYIKFLRIPVVRIVVDTQRYLFYSMSSFKRFINGLPAGARISDPEYFKGLGTSEDHHIKEDFNNPRIVTFQLDADAIQRVLLAFHRAKANDRKQWISDWTNRQIIDTDNMSDLPISYFIDHEMIDYSIENVIRSIPEAIDGMKESQRKALYAAIKKLDGKKKKDKIKVAQIASYAAEVTCYKHGEGCLADTVVQMAHDFLFSNNLPPLKRRAQMGCVDPNTPILCWNGHWKLAKHITVNDILVGDDGNPRHISQIVGGIDVMYDVKQKYGSDYRVNSEHILTLHFHKHKKIYWKAAANKWHMEYFDNVENKIKSKEFSATATRSKDDAEKLIRDFANTIPDNNIFDINLQTYLSYPVSRRALFMSVHNTKPIQWPKRDVPIDPYIYGIWLGDGRSNGRGFTSADPELVKEWVVWLDKIDVEVVHHKSGEKGFHYGFRKKGYSYGNSLPIGHRDHSSKICGACKNSTNIHPACDWIFDGRKDVNDIDYSLDNNFVELLKKYNLYDNKHILEVFIINDEETRLQLLAGLIDTDGTLTHKDIDGSECFEICQEMTTHGHIIDSIDYIAKSLGFKTMTSVSVRPDSTLKRIRITGDISRIPTRLSRKHASRKEPFTGSSITVICCGEGEYVGWHIDGNERFLHADFTVMHNTRNKGGKDAAAPRYTNVSLPYYHRYIHRPEDKRLYKRVMDEGEPQEYENFYPILPPHVINGVIGIGTAWSTNIPQHHPLDVAFYTQQRLLQDLRPDSNYQLPTLRPWTKGFTGDIILTERGFRSEGRLVVVNNNTAIIEELPLGTWTQDYESNYLVKWEEEGLISSYESYCTDEKVKFVIHDYRDGIPSLKKLKLISKHSYRNMTVLYRSGDRGILPRIYSNIRELLEDFYKLRLAKYVERKELMLMEFDQAIHDMSERARYIHAVAVDRSLEIRDRPKAEVHADMTRMGLDTALMKAVGSHQLTKEEIAKLQNKIMAKRAEKDRISQIAPQQMWYDEIQEFVNIYCKTEKCEPSTFESCNPSITLTIGHH